MLRRTSINFVNNTLSKNTNWKILDIGCGYRANKNATIIADIQDLSNHYKGLEILGPAACFKEKIKNNFRFQIILKSIKIYDSNGEKLHSFINCNFFNDKPINSGANKINIHVDPISMI